MPLPLMTAKSTHTSVTTTPVKLYDFDATRVQASLSGSARMYVGGPDVTSSNGLNVQGDLVYTIPTTGAQAELWAVASSGTITVSALEFKIL